ncbi:MAG: SURF1 family protein [Pseudomonadales bacterium]|nr:SURF1 family protein [Pseudomonadales bacterium]
MKTVLQLGKWQFRINWLIACCVLMTVALLINLGFWQLGRAQEKRDLQRAMLERLEEAPLPLAAVLPRQGPLTEEQGQQLENLGVTATGHYWNEASFVVSFQFFQGAPGYELITPFELEDTGEFVLVSRGWVTPGPGADGMPYVPAVEGEQTLRAQLHVPPAVAGTSQVEGEGWPLRFRYLDINRASALMQRPLLPWVLRLAPEQAGVFARHWPAVTVNTRMHIQYALQWFGMALVVLVVSFLMSSNFLALRQQARRARD